MLYKCANGACSTPFRRLREGKLFQVETEYSAGHTVAGTSSRRGRMGRHIEHYWLCDACSPFVTLTFEKERGVVTVPLSDGTGTKTVKMISGDEAASAMGIDGLSPRGIFEVRK